jgi:hypothetical protein
VIYVDSSVALAHLLVEPRSPRASLWSGPLVSSQLLEYEVWNWIHAYDLGRSHANEVQALLIRVDLIEMTAAVLARALEPFPTPSEPWMPSTSRQSNMSGTGARRSSSRATTHACSPPPRRSEYRSWHCELGKGD